MKKYYIKFYVPVTFFLLHDTIPVRKLIMENITPNISGSFKVRHHYYPFQMIIFLLLIVGFIFIIIQAEATLTIVVACVFISVFIFGFLWCLLLLRYGIEVKKDELIFTPLFGKKRIFSIQDLIFVQIERETLLTLLFWKGNVKIIIKDNKPIYTYKRLVNMDRFLEKFKHLQSIV